MRSLDLSTEVKDSINEKLADEKLEILMKEESEKLRLNYVMEKRLRR